MIIISFVSQKGGVGKSTLARATAQELKNSGMSVKLADLDTQQGTVTNWHIRRLQNGFDSIGSVECFGSLQEAINNIDSYDAIVIDGAGRSSVEVLDIAKISDVVVQPSDANLDALIPANKLMLELIQKEIAFDKLFVALCRVTSENQEKLAREFLGQAGCNVLDGAIYNKTAYDVAQNDGKTIIETGYKTLDDNAKEIVNNILVKVKKTYGQKK